MARPGSRLAVAPNREIVEDSYERSREEAALNQVVPRGINIDAARSGGGNLCNASPARLGIGDDTLMWNGAAINDDTFEGRKMRSASPGAARSGTLAIYAGKRDTIELVT